jgi:hypothetical protein
MHLISWNYPSGSEHFLLQTGPDLKTGGFSSFTATTVFLKNKVVKVKNELLAAPPPPKLVTG